MVARQGHLHQRRSQQVVARKHSHLVVEHGVNRKLSATLGTLVDHVVVHQAGVVEQLQRHGRVESLQARPAVELGREQHQDGAHHLPAPLTDVFYHTVQQRIGAGERTFKQLSEVFQFGRNGGLYH